MCYKIKLKKITKETLPQYNKKVFLYDSKTGVSKIGYRAKSDAYGEHYDIDWQTIFGEIRYYKNFTHYAELTFEFDE